MIEIMDAQNSKLPLNFFETEVFNSNFAFLDENFSTRRLIFRQFSESPKF